MLNISKLSQRPRAFQRLVGLTPQQFKALVATVEPRWQQAELRRQAWSGRQRKIGGGRTRKLDLAQSVFMLLVYYRSYASHLFLGLIMGIDDSNVCRYLRRLEPVLAQVFKIPKRAIRLSQDEIWALVVDATEQETQKRPGTGYSGKKKRQTLKTQVVFNTLRRQVSAVSDSVPGNVHDKKLYDQTRAYARASQGGLRKVKFRADLGYQGTACDLPKKKPPGRLLMMHEEYFNRCHSRARIPIEHLFAHLKQFRILQDRYRNPAGRYNLTFRNVCGLRNLAAVGT